MQRVIDMRTMRESDAETIRRGTPSKELMYRAGVAIFEAFPWKGKTAIVCGVGNNAGDGYVLASLLTKQKIDCSLILLSDRFSEDGRYYFDQCMDMGIETIPYTSDFDFSPYSEIVDCIFGTGFSGDVQSPYKEVIQRIRQNRHFGGYQQRSLR